MHSYRTTRRRKFCNQANLRSLVLLLPDCRQSADGLQTLGIVSVMAIFRQLTTSRVEGCRGFSRFLQTCVTLQFCAAGELRSWKCGANDDGLSPDNSWKS